MHAKDNPSNSSASLQKPKITKTKAKKSLSQESELCYFKMRAQRPQFISSK
jgi:hypothetical protein